MKKLLTVMLTLFMLVSLTACDWEWWMTQKNSMKGSLIGVEYNATFYTNNGEKFMSMHGENIDLDYNTVREWQSDGTYSSVVSSVVTITIDGKEVESCGSTIIFAESGLEPDVDFQIQDIDSSNDGSFSQLTSVAGIVNYYKNMFGKPRVVVIQSQLGVPIVAYSGDSVYYEVCESLPKTTKLSIDGKVLYIHRANFQIIDLDLLS